MRGVGGGGLGISRAVVPVPSVGGRGGAIGFRI